MIFRKAELQDCNAVYSLYRTLAGRPLCTWDAEYPGWLQINEDYESGGLYVMAQDEGIVGAISIVPENELDALPFWRFQNAREIARVAVAPGQQGKVEAYPLCTCWYRRIIFRPRGYTAGAALISWKDARCSAWNSSHVKSCCSPAHRTRRSSTP